MKLSLSKIMGRVNIAATCVILVACGLSETKADKSIFTKQELHLLASFGVNRDAATSRELAAIMNGARDRLVGASKHHLNREAILSVLGRPDMLEENGSFTRMFYRTNSQGEQAFLVLVFEGDTYFFSEYMWRVE